MHSSIIKTITLLCFAFFEIITNPKNQEIQSPNKKLESTDRNLEGYVESSSNAGGSTLSTVDIRVSSIMLEVSINIVKNKCINTSSIMLETSINTQKIKWIDILKDIWIDDSIMMPEVSIHMSFSMTFCMSESSLPA
jgi:hypothetical protein